MYYLGPLSLTFKGPEHSFGGKTAKMGIREKLDCRVCIISCNFPAKLVMHNCARAEHSKTCTKEFTVSINSQDAEPEKMQL